MDLSGQNSTRTSRRLRRFCIPDNKHHQQSQVRRQKTSKIQKNKATAQRQENKRRSKVESDWRDYWGSSEHLQADVEALGPEKFTREILHYCNSRGLMSYLEAREQFERRVLETDEYYNGIINVRVGSSKILKEALEKLGNT